LRKCDDNSFVGLKCSGDLQKAAQEEEGEKEELHFDAGRTGDR
jgi:hypothetical protein